MLLLHLSDIHFRARDTESAQDPNRGLRATLLEDIVSRFEELEEKPAQVLISGDIAFAGAKEEYKFAKEWLNELCDGLGIPHRHVFVIPGNHDVDQAVTETISVRVLHEYIKKNTTAERSDTFRELLNDPTTSESLYKALQNYNDFAAGYSCLLAPPNETYASEILDLADGWKLNLIGLNSAFVSSKNDDVGTLFVDNASFSIQPTNGHVNLVMCHHPYNWLRFGEELKNNLEAAAEIQLFGHEHIVRPEIGRDYVCLRSPAIHPDPIEAPWEPGYNIIDVNISEVTDKTFLHVKAYVKKWQQRPPMFVPLFDKGHTPFFEQNILIARPAVQTSDSKLSEAVDAETVGIASMDENVGGSPIPPLTEYPKPIKIKELTFLFFALSYPQQSEIVASLDLAAEGDANKPASIRFSNALKLAKAREILPKILKAIERQETST